jgi:hypothetical protein
MAANDQLDAFLAEGAPAAPEPAPTPAAPAPTPAPEAKAPPAPASTPAAKAAPEAKAKEPEPEEDDAEEFEPARDGEVLVPRRALETERSRRKDWKEKAARFEGELAATKRQLEEATRRAQAPQQQPQQPVYQAPIDPVADPQGFLQRVQNVMLNERLNNSEQMLRREVGAEKVDAAIEDFRQAAQDDPSLFQKLYAQPDPYGWAYKQVERLRLLREVGDDPATFRARVAAEERAKWEQEQTVKPPAPSPAAGFQPSLANARSVAGRSAPPWSDVSLEEVLAPVINRKKRQA